MDKRFKPMTPAQQIAARQSLYDGLAATPGMPLKDAIKLILERLHLTAPELAKLTGVSERFLRDTAAGRGNPSLSTAAKVLAPFGLVMGVLPKHKENGR